MLNYAKLDKKLRTIFEKPHPRKMPTHVTTGDEYGVEDLVSANHILNVITVCCVPIFLYISTFEEVMEYFCLVWFFF